MIEGFIFLATRFMTMVAGGNIDGIVIPPDATRPSAGGADAVLNGAYSGANGAYETITNVVTGTGVTPAEATGGGGWTIMIIYAGVLIVAMYFLMFRGPRKREKKMRELQASIRVGDNVVVSGGMFGRITDVGEDCFVVEFGTNRGIRIPVLKSDVLGVREPKLTPPQKVDVPKADASEDTEKEKDKEKK